MTEAPHTDRVVIAVDPHKASWTAAAVDALVATRWMSSGLLSAAEGYRRLRRFAQRWTNPGWAIEGAAGLGAPLTQRLHADGWRSPTCPPNSPPGCGCCPPGMAAKPTKPTPSRSGIAALTATRLNTASVERGHHPLRAVVEHMTTRGVSHPLLSLPSVGRKWAAPRRGADRGRVWLIATSYGPGTGGSGSCAPPTHIQTRESKWHRIDTHSGRHFCTSKIGHSGP